MVKHIVLWMLKPEAKATKECLEANMSRQMARFREMQQDCPMIRALNVYPSFRTGTDIYDFAVVMDFDSREDLEAFQKSPGHKNPKASSFGLSIRERKAVVDIEIP